MDNQGNAEVPQEGTQAHRWALEKPGVQGYLEVSSQSPVKVLCAPGVAKPVIICLCGSGRFKADFERVAGDETMKGKVVLAPYRFLSPEEKTLDIGEMLDDLHKYKIAMSDEVLIINPGGYVSESTLSEIQYATAIGKPVAFLEPSYWSRRKPGKTNPRISQGNRDNHSILG